MTRSCVRSADHLAVDTTLETQETQATKPALLQQVAASGKNKAVLPLLAILLPACTSLVMHVQPCMIGLQQVLAWSGSQQRHLKDIHLKTCCNIEGGKFLLQQVAGDCNNKAMCPVQAILLNAIHSSLVIKFAMSPEALTDQA